MERRFRVRLQELLDDAHVPPGLLRGLCDTLPALALCRMPRDAADVRQIAAHFGIEKSGLAEHLGLR